jgi:hypothetical protein
MNKANVLDQYKVSVEALSAMVDTLDATVSTSVDSMTPEEKYPLVAKVLKIFNVSAGEHTFEHLNKTDIVGTDTDNVPAGFNSDTDPSANADKFGQGGDAKLNIDEQINTYDIE